MFMRVAKAATFAPAVLAIVLLVAWGAVAFGEPAASHAPARGAEAVGTEHGSPHGGEDTGLNPLNTWKTDMALWTAVVFVLLLLVLGRFAWGPIADGLEKRESRIAGEIQAAEKANSDAKALLNEYQQKLNLAGDEVRQLIEQAKREAEVAGQRIVGRAREEADAEKRRAVADIELATAGALKEMAERSADLAVSLAGKIVQQRLSASEHSALINEAVAKFAKLEPGKN